MDTDRLPPQSAEAEANVIGCLLRDGADGGEANALGVVRAILVPEDFYLSQNLEAYRSALRLGDRGSPVDLVTLWAQIQADGKAEIVGSPLTLIQALEAAPSAWTAAWTAKIVKERSRRRQLVHAGLTLARGGYDLTTDVDESARVGQETLAEIQRQATADETTLEALAAEVEREMDGHHSGIRWSTGLDWLDDVTGGLGRDQGWVIAGRSGHCKTAFGLNLTLAILEQGGTVCFFRWEERPQVMAARLASLVTRIPYADVRRHSEELSPGDYQTFREGLKSCAEKYKPYFWVYRGLDLAQVEATIAKRQPWLCVYDTLQAAAMQVPKDPRTRHDLHVASLCSAITRLRGRYGHCSLVVSQLNSEGQERESRAIREDNDVCLDLNWPYKEDPVHDSTRIVVTFRKNRLGGIEPRLVTKISPGTQRFGARLPPDEERAFLEACK